MRDLRGEELEEAVELVGVAAERRRQLRRVGVLGRLDRAHLHLQLPAEPLHAPEHAHRVALAEAPVEQLDVAPDARLDAPARVGELEREVRSCRRACGAAPSRDREHALDRPVLGELGDRGHGPSLWAQARWYARARWPTCSRSAPSATPARPVRSRISSRRRTTPSTTEERAELFARSPYNVVHVTLPDSADEAGRALPRAGSHEGILVRDDEPAAWLLVERLRRPGRRRPGAPRARRVPRRRAVRDRTRAPARAHAPANPRGAAAPAARDARQPEPIFLLTEEPLGSTVPERAPDLEVDGTRLWRLADVRRLAATLADRSS